MLNVNPRQLNMEENIKWLMTAHQELDNRVFNTNQKMLPEIRRRLLFRAQIFIDNSVKNFPWLQVDDIFLGGSAATYSYQEFSDLDLFVLVSNNKDSEAFSSAEQIGCFAPKVSYRFGKQKLKFDLEQRQVEIKAIFKALNVPSYSLLRDEWVTKPTRQIMDNINTDEILAKAQDIVSKIKYMRTDQFERPNGKYSIEDIKQIESYFNSLLKMPQHNTEEWLIYKLVSYTGELHRLRNFYTSQLAKTLSF